MARIIIGNHLASYAAHADQDRIRRFYRDVLGCKVNVAGDEVDRYQLEDFHIIVVWSDNALPASGFLSATYLELKTDDPAALQRKLAAFGVHQLEVPDPHCYFQAPNGQVFRVVGINEDLSIYEHSTSARPGARA